MLDSTSARECELESPTNRRSKSPILVAITCWFDSLPKGLLTSLDLSQRQLLESAPKRWSLYFPMILLPSGSFGSEWNSIINRTIAPSPIHEYSSDLWKLILHYIEKKEGKGRLTHLAINSGIPRYEIESEQNQTKKENILRTPSGLIPLYGDFGSDLPPSTIPTQQDFDEAFWVSTKQNGILQVWAPRHTMFSRGNVKEKGRLLKFHSDHDLSEDDLSATSALDLYAGIGYFVFSYVKMGIGRVFGWELNPWSVEGLRRGALANKWEVKVIRNEDKLSWTSEKIIIFLGDNSQAYMKLMQVDALGDIKHVNCGLLPTSIASWKTALQCVTSQGWLHLHENVSESDVSERKFEIEKICNLWLNDNVGMANVKYVEYVKTFAPRIWHCVFDVYIEKISQRPRTF